MLILFDILLLLCVAMVTSFGGYAIYRLVSDESGRR